MSFGAPSSPGGTAGAASVDPAVLERLAVAAERQADAAEAVVAAAEQSAVDAALSASAAGAAADDAAASATAAASSAAAASASADASEDALTTAAAAEATAVSAVDAVGWNAYFPPAENVVIVPHAMGYAGSTSVQAIAGGGAGGEFLSGAFYLLPPGAKVTRVAVRTGGPSGASTARLALYECEKGRARTRIWQSAPFLPVLSGSYEEVELAEPLVVEGGFYFLAMVCDTMDEENWLSAHFYAYSPSGECDLLLFDALYGSEDLSSLVPLLRPAYAWAETSPGRWEGEWQSEAPLGAPAVLPWPEEHPDFAAGDQIVNVGSLDSMVSYIGVER